MFLSIVKSSTLCPGGVGARLPQRSARRGGAPGSLRGTVHLSFWSWAKIEGSGRYTQAKCGEGFRSRHPCQWGLLGSFAVGGRVGEIVVIPTEHLDAALRASRPTECLREVVRRFLDQGYDRQALAEDLESFRDRLRAEGREADEDIVLEVMDFLAGWCSPHMAL